MAKPVKDNDLDIIDQDAGKRDLRWVCLTCDFSAQPTGKGYSEFLNHHCTGKKTGRLVDIDTGEELANNIKQAQALGLIPKKRKTSDNSSKAKRAAPAGMETPLPGGEGISGIIEKEEDTIPEEATTGKDKNKRYEGVSDEFIEGEAIWVKAKISAKTLLYYQYFTAEVKRSDHGRDITIGDFFDVVADDYFKGRNLSLGLVGLGESN